MRLYKITTNFYGKDLDQGAILGYAVAENDDGIYDHINEKILYDEWPDSVGMTRENIIAAKGDSESRRWGEFYSQRYGWEDFGEVSPEDIANLKRLKILPN